MNCVSAPTLNTIMTPEEIYDILVELSQSKVAVAIDDTKENIVNQIECILNKNQSGNLSTLKS